MADRTRELIRELMALSQEQATCTLEVSAEAISCSIHVVAGAVVAVNEATPGEPLGRLLVRKQLLSHEQYIEVLDRMTAALALGEELRFGEVATELGYLTAAQVGAALAEQVRWRAIRVIQRGDATWSRRETGERSTRGDVAPMSLEAIVLDAVRWIDDERKERMALGEAWEKRLRAAWPVEEIEARFELSAAEAAFVADAVAGDATVADLLAIAASDSVDPHAILATLLATGALAAREERATLAVPSTPSMRPPAKGPPPLPAWATVDTNKARGALAKVKLVRMDAKAQAAALEKRAATKGGHEGLLAEQYLQRAKTHLRKGEATEALVHLAEAARYVPGSKEIALYVMWARAAETGDPLVGDLGPLQACAEEAIRENPNTAFAHFVVGEILKVKGDESLSRRHLRHALRLEPEIFDAERALRLREMRSTRRLDERPAGTVPPVVTKTMPVPAAATSSSPIVAGPPPMPHGAPPHGAPPHGAPPHGAAPAGAPASPQGAAAPKGAPAKAGGSGKVLVLVLGLVLVVGGAAAAFFLSQGGAAKPSIQEPSDPLVATTAPTASTPEKAILPMLVGADASAAVDASAAPMDAGAEKDAGAAKDGGAAAKDGGSGPADAGAAGAIPADRGVLLLGPHARGHRIFVDDRFEGDGKERLMVRCGSRSVRIGSQGKARTLDVPCGKEIPFD